jgi:DNA polymerase V
VLSNNDGCVIARSKEAKAMPASPWELPAFECRQLFLRHNVAVLSSNFSLYGDISCRVMETLESFGYPLEVYSIDEAFIEIPAEPRHSFWRRGPQKSTAVDWHSDFNRHRLH